MNFVCDKCKQKYHVADEKIRGRAVTRFRCKKCENVIELRSDALPDPDAPGAPRQADGPDDRPRPATMAPSSPRPAVTAISGGAIGAAGAAPKAPARTRAPTSVGVAFNAGMAATAAKPAAAPRTASTSAILNASETGWYAGIRDLPVGPLTRKELVAKVQSAEVTPDTLVWREGLDDWRPLRNVAELGDVLRLGAQRISGNLLDEMGRRTPSAPSPATAEPRRSGQVVPLRQPLATPSAPAMTRPTVTDDDEEATRVTGMDPAIAALVPKALGLDRVPAAKAPVEAEDAGEQTLVEPPHSPMSRSLGLDAQNKGGIRAPAPKAPPPKPPVAPKPPPPKTAPVAGFGPKPASVPPPPEKPASVPPPAVTVESSPALKVSSAPPAPLSSMPAPAAVSSAPPGEDELPEDLFGRKPLPPPSAAPSLESFGLSSAFSSMPPPNSAPAPAPFGAMPSQPFAGSAPPAAMVPVAAQQQRPGGLSLPVVILMVGVLVLGVFGGVVLAGRLNRPVAPPGVPAPVPVPALMPAPVAAPSPVPAAPGPEAVAAGPEVAPTAPTTAEPEVPGSSGHHHHSPSARQPTAPAAPQISEGDRQRLAALAAASGGGPVGPVNPGRAPTQNNAAQNNSPALSGSARAERAVSNFNSARVVNGCWQNLLRMNPSVQPARVTIRLEIGASGRITGARVENSPDPRFTSCINSGATRVAPVSPGEPAGAELNVSLTAGG